MRVPYRKSPPTPLTQPTAPVIQQKVVVVPDVHYGTLKTQLSTNKYPALTFIALLLRYFAYIIAGLIVVGAIVGIINNMQKGDMKIWDILGLILAIPGAAIVWMILTLIPESIQVMLNIEENTRITAEKIKNS